MTLVRFCGFDMEFSEPNVREMAFNEFPLWEKYYLPADPKGLTVLDAGADVGFTAAFYFAHGARKVVAVELSSERCQALRRNAQVNGWDIQVIEGPFRKEHLAIPHDLFKSDCEQGEKELYDWQGTLKPCMIETHTVEITETLLARYPLKVVYPLSKDGWHTMFLQLKDSPFPEYEEWNRRAEVKKPEDDSDYLRRFEPEQYLKDFNPFTSAFGLPREKQ